jgi:MFS transporter, DHA1 family, inner membrane transport protein
MPIEYSSEAFVQEHQSGRVIVAAMFVGAAAMMVLGLQPILLGALTSSGRLSESGLGQVAMVETFAFAAGSAIGPYILSSGSMRARVLAASLLLAMANMGMYVAHSASMIFMLRGAAGLIEGLLLGAAIIILTHARHPARVNGLFLAFTTAPQIAGAYLLPAIIMPSLGSNAGFGILTGFAFIAMLAAPFLVDRIHIERRQRGGRPNWNPALALLLFGAFVQSAGIGAAWNYTERLGSQIGVSSSVVGIAIAGSLFLQLVGALVSAWASGRSSACMALLAGTIVQAMIIIALAILPSPKVFIVCVGLFGLFWLALQPFLVSELVALDPSRRAAFALAPILLVGLGIGPLLASLSVRKGDVSGGFWEAGGFFVVATLLYGAAFLFKRQMRQADASVLPA